MESFVYRGWSLKYVHLGRGKGRPIIFLHNGGASHVIWREVMAQLEGDYEMFAFDLLGFGESDKPGPGCLLLDNYIGFVSAFIDDRALAPVSLVGNCMGCSISVGLAKQRPGDVRALVLINPLTEATFLGGMLGTLLRMRKRKPELSRKIYKKLGGIRIPNWMASQSLRFQIGPRGKSLKVYQNPDLCHCFSSPGQMESLLGVLDDLVNYDFMDRFEPGLDFPPVCTIWGQNNRILSPQVGRRLNQTLRPVRQEWLEGCGHLLMLEQPERVAAIIHDFLETVPGTSTLSTFSTSESSDVQEAEGEEAGHEGF
ncbi:MAG TPA: alpha/beta hydrolase [Bacillota bacterium]|nr:alpha/beta hydrolase [Bacillota bacterium]HPT33649.1 alpha/beta hydrolase [Bacillota bacterium]